MSSFRASLENPPGCVTELALHDRCKHQVMCAQQEGLGDRILIVDYKLNNAELQLLPYVMLLRTRR